jgi:predicted nucleic acid-binding protein
MHREESSSPTANTYVLDSYALLAYLGGEPGSKRVAEFFESAREGKVRLIMCVVNLGEVMYIIERELGLPKAQEALARINELPISIVDVNHELTMSAAHLKVSCPIAYADCFAAALSQINEATLVTGDPEFNKIKAECNLQVEWLVEKK